MKWDTNWDADKKKRTAIGSLNHAVRFHWDGEKITWAEDNTEKIPTDAEIDAEVIRLQANWIATEYSRARENEYPDYRDYLDAIVKGDDTQKQKYIDDCKAVKLKYPKN